MKLRTTFILFFVLLFALAGTNLVLGLHLEKAQRELEAAEDEMAALNVIADRLVISSQWQTRFARAYIANKDPRRLDWYNRINEILDGKIAAPNNYDLEYWDLVAGTLVPPPENKTEGAETIEDAFLKHNITPVELNKLKEARIYLSKINATEQLALHAVIGQFDCTAARL